MKTRLIFLVLLIVSFSCGTNNKPVSDAQKEKIQGEVKEVVNTIFKGAEEANFEMATEPWIDSPDFVYSYNGNSYGYKEFVDAMKPMFGSFLNQKCTIVGEKFAILDNSTVSYTANTKWLVNYKDGHSILQDPWVMQVIFKKIDKKWKVINCVESGVEQSVKNSETSKELNQVELMKQFIGTWKWDVSKDTTSIFDFKSYGTGIEGYFKYITKGKIVMEGKQLWGYDKRVDKYILSFLTKGMDVEGYAVWFTSKNKYEWIPYSDISNPENASFKFTGVFKSNDLFLETYIKNNKEVAVWTFTRIK
jgi:hypothetical protein